MGSGTYFRKPFEFLDNSCYSRPGVYAIINTVSGDFYIGSSINMKYRINGHRCRLLAGDNGSILLQNSCNACGGDKLCAVTIEFCEKERLLEREQFYLDALFPRLNMAKFSNSIKGVKHSQAFCERVSRSNKGKLAWNKGLKMSPETIERMAESHTGAKNFKAIPVFCVELNTLFESSNIAEKFIRKSTGFPAVRSVILRKARSLNENKKAYGYTWELAKTINSER